MSRIAALSLAFVVALGPAGAEEITPAPEPAPESGTDGDMREGMDLLGEGMRLFFKGLSDELEPALRDMAKQMQPAMQRLLELMDDFEAYELPEKLPNGDIIIRRKPEPPPGTTPEGEIDI